MGWLDALSGKTVGLDTAPLIYFIEQDPVRTAKLRPFFSAAERGDFRLVTSLVTLIEVLVHPLKSGRRDLARSYQDILLRSPALLTLPLDVQIAEAAAGLRALHSFRTPDAIQLATAIHSGASHFLTNDSTLAQATAVSVMVLDHLPEP